MTPLVSCIMPTEGRPEFARQAVKYFARQTYPNKELVIWDGGGSGSLAEYVTAHLGDLDFVYILGRRPCSLGLKRNKCIESSSGRLIAHWDDDDWYGTTRLADQVSLMQSHELEVCGHDAPLFCDLRTGRGYRYHFADGCPYGATLMYSREFWMRRPFLNVQVGETDPFIQGRWPDASSRIDWFVGMAHGGNTLPKALQTRFFAPYPESLPLGSDWDFYCSLREKMGVAA